MDSFSEYLVKIVRYPLLTKQQEILLTGEFKSGLG